MSLSCRSAVRQRVAPTVEETTLRTIRRLLHVELTGIVMLILCAAMMARAIGFFG